MKKSPVTMILLGILLVAGSFCAYAGPDSGDIASDKDNYSEWPYPTYNVDNRHYGGTTKLYPFYVGQYMQWEDGVMKYYYAPSDLIFDDCFFSGDNNILLEKQNAISTGVNWVDCGEFNGDTLISNENSGYINPEPSNHIDDSTFNGDTVVDTHYQLASAGGGIGTQISGSTFNDNTTLNVQSGGTLEITDSTINLADESIMDQYLGVNSPLLNAINQFGLKFVEFLNIVVYWNEKPAIAGQDYVVSSFNGLSTNTYLPYWTLSYLSYANNHITFTQEVKARSWSSAISMAFMYICWDFQAIGAWLSDFMAYYYPFQVNQPLVWYAWNTDTSSREQTNLATVLYYVTWYLGQMFQMNTWGAGSELETPISDLNDKFTDLDDAETILVSITI